MNAGCTANLKHSPTPASLAYMPAARLEPGTRGSCKRSVGSNSAPSIVTAGIQVTTAVPAVAVPGFVRVVKSSSMDSSRVKGMLAMCPTGTRIIGGGAWIVDSGARCG
jgi:hypothetical protein